jgi:phosphoribosylformylglycinamidine synthase subunit PurQ / glutaminase
MSLRFGIIVFPGSNCDRDVHWVTAGILGQPTRMVWHGDSDLSDLDVVVVPGGFSYGDYLRCGAIARFSPAMRATVEHANAGKPVIGICNGFQILTEVGLLPGALVRNANLHFICEPTPLRVEQTRLIWTQQYAVGENISLPIAHGEGRYYADADCLATLEDQGQVVFRYLENPNGSCNDIAGICNRGRNVLGLMPHPERAAETLTGGKDGLRVFESVLAAAIAV